MKKLNKAMITCIGSIVLVLTLAVGCSSSNTTSSELDTTQFLTEQGKESIENCNKFEYIEITDWNAIMGEYKDKKVKISGTVESLHYNEKLTKFLLNVESNNTALPIEIKIPSQNINIQFAEGDTITVKGRFDGSVTKDLEDGKTFSYWTISAYVLENIK